MPVTGRCQFGASGRGDGCQGRFSRDMGEEVTAQQQGREGRSQHSGRGRHRSSRCGRGGHSAAAGAGGEVTAEQQERWGKKCNKTL